MTARYIALMLLVTSAFGIACDSSRATQPALDPAVLTTLEVVPSTVALALEWGSSAQLGLAARDQRGVPMYSGRVTFSSSNSAIARVSGSGLVLGVAAGTADVSVTYTVAGVTQSAAVKATVHPGFPSSLVIRADSERGWQPSVAHLTAGGTVQWLTAGPRSWSDVPHRFLYLMDERYAVVDSLDLSTGSATLKLPTAGEYRYCSAGCWDPPDHGIVYVH